MTFLLGLILGIPAGAYLTYRYRVQIQEWLDMRGE